jgi:hypothetical protein
MRKVIELECDLPPDENGNPRNEELRTPVFDLGRDREFADSPLEGAGFEPSVPRKIGWSQAASSRLCDSSHSPKGITLDGQTPHGRQPTPLTPFCVSMKLAAAHQPADDIARLQERALRRDIGGQMESEAIALLRRGVD